MNSSPIRPRMAHATSNQMLLFSYTVTISPNEAASSASPMLTSR